MVAHFDATRIFARIPDDWMPEGYLVSGGLPWKAALWRPTHVTTPLQNFGSTFVPKGISLPDLSPAAPALLVGSSGTGAYRVLDDNSNGAIIPHLPLPAGPPSAALGICGNKNWPASSSIKHWAVGFSTKYGKSRPVVWNNPGATVGIDMIPRDLSSLLGSDNVREGKAFAVNCVGVAVGASTHFSGEATVSRPFRTQENAASILDTDRLLPPEGIAGADGSGTAESVTYVSSGPAFGSWAAGWTFTGNSEQVGTYWKPGGSVGLPTTPVKINPLRRLASDGYYDEDTQSAVKGVSKNLIIVGWSGPNATSGSRRAVLWRSGIWQDLNDKHFIGTRPSDWTLHEAVAVSDSDIIIAIGSSFSSSTNSAFVLVPRSLSE